MDRTALHRTLIALLLLALCDIGRAASPKPVAENLILVTLDGMRWQEIFGGADEQLIDAKVGGVRDVAGTRRRFWRATPEERRATLMPFLWTVIAKDGQIFGDPAHTCEAKITNGKKFSYPGYNELLCGFPDPRIDSNKPIANENVSVLEWLNQRPAYAGKVSVFGTWSVLPFILNVNRSHLPVVAGWTDLKESPLSDKERIINELMPDMPHVWNDNVFDFIITTTALEHVKRHQPKVLYVQLGETDEWAHGKRYDMYLESAFLSDLFLQRLWSLVQSIPQYQGKTALLITTDHGRGSTGLDWINHTTATPGPEFIWMAAMSPDVKGLGVRENLKVTQSQIAATAAALLGEDYHAAAPRSAQPLPLWEGEGK